MTLDNLVSQYKQHEVDFIMPDHKDRHCYLDLYLLYESPEQRWHKVQSIIYHYFNTLLKEYRARKISSDQLIKKLYFPEVPWIGLGYSKDGIHGQGSAFKRAKTMKCYIFDDPAIKQIGMTAIAEMSIALKDVGPDLLSDMVANLGMSFFLEYTSEQTNYYDLETAEFPIQRILDPDTLKWRPNLKIKLPYFESPRLEPRILVPKHIIRRLPTFTTQAFYDDYVRFVLKQERESKLDTVRTIGKKPRITFKAIKQELKAKFGTIGEAVRKFAKDKRGLVSDYVSNPRQFEDTRRRRKVLEKINWQQYIDELKALQAGSNTAKQYAMLLKKIFTALYSGKLTGGRLEQRSVDGIFRYDLIFGNSAETTFFKMAQNQQVTAGVLIIEAKNYDHSSLSNDDFNQSRSYTLVDGRELIFLVTRKDITRKDIERASRHFLSQRCLVLPLSDNDIIALLDARMSDSVDFDRLVADRLTDILGA